MQHADAHYPFTTGEESNRALDSPTKTMPADGMPATEPFIPRRHQAMVLANSVKDLEDLHPTNLSGNDFGRQLGFGPT